MATAKQQKLVDLLFDRSKEGKLNWSEGVNTNSFQVAFSEYSVVLSAQDTDHIDVDYSLLVMNTDGEIVDEITDNEMAQGTLDPKKIYKKFHDLFEMARRTARGSDEALNSIIEELDDGMPF